MHELEVPCQRCQQRVNVSLERTLLHIGEVPLWDAELVFLCPACGTCSAFPLETDACITLLHAGAVPFTLRSPSLDPADMPPPGEQFGWDDLLCWHERLDRTTSVAPWL
jgi:hypothetical protein